MNLTKAYRAENFLIMPRIPSFSVSKKKRDCLRQGKAINKENKNLVTHRQNNLLRYLSHISLASFFEGHRQAVQNRIRRHV